MTSRVAAPADAGRTAGPRAAQPASAHQIRGLYAVTPDGLADTQLLERCAAALRGGAQVLQYRNKQGNPLDRVRQAQALRALTRQQGALLIINDDPLLAQLVQADGVHLGSQDPAIRAVRTTYPDLLVGASCYNQLALAEQAVAAGAHYVAFGAMATSSTKPQAVHAPASLLGEARRLQRPVVAIGGITTALATPLIHAGADALAVITALFEAPDVEAAARAFTTLFTPPDPRERPHHEP